MKKIVNKASILTLVFLAFTLVSNAQINRKKKANEIG